MAALSDFSIVTPAEVKYEGQAEIVVAPGAAGDIGVLANHAPLLTTLRIGVLSASVIRTAVSDAKPIADRVEYAVNGGFLQVLHNKIAVLSDMALGAADIDVATASAELKRAEEALSQKRGSDDRAERESVAWATAQLQVARK